MLLFAATMNIIMTRLRERGFDVIAYADDLNIAHNGTQSAAEIIKIVSAELKKFGLTVNTQKCESTEFSTINWLG